MPPDRCNSNVWMLFKAFPYTIVYRYCFKNCCSSPARCYTSGNCCSKIFHQPGMTRSLSSKSNNNTLNFPCFLYPFSKPWSDFFNNVKKHAFLRAYRFHLFHPLDSKADSMASLITSAMIFWFPTTMSISLSASGVSFFAFSKNAFALGKSVPTILP